MLKLLISDIRDGIVRAAAQRGIGKTDADRNRFRWELRFFWKRWRPFFDFDSFMDGGTKFWHVGPVAVYRWIVHPGEE